MKLIRKLKKKLFRKKEASAVAVDERNEYYENISARLGLVQVVLFLGLFAFVVVSILANTRLITYQNFYYFFQDLGASAETVDIFDADSVSYLTSEEQDFAIYRGGLAVTGNTSVTIFSATGRQTLSASVQFRNPTAVGKGKYLLVYELGGYRYALYNANTELHSGKTDTPIAGAAVSDNGMYALVSSEASSSTVSLYSDRFQLLNRYHKSGYVTDVSIDQEGDMIAILTSLPGGGLYSTKLMLAVPGEGKARAETEVATSLGLSCSFTDNGNVIVLTTEGVCSLSSNGSIREEYSFEEQELALFDMSEDGLAVVLKKNRVSDKNIVIVFDKNGKIVYNEVVSTDVLQITRSEKSVFWMTDDGVQRVNLGTRAAAFAPCSTDKVRLLAIGDAEVLCCSAKKAIYLSFR